MKASGNERYSGPAMLLHWSMALLLLAQIGIGLYMVGIPKKTPPVAFYYNLHKSLGLIVLALALVRVWWRLRARVPALPLSGTQACAAKATHRLLYGCMLLTPLCGFIASNFTRHGVYFFGYALPVPGWEDHFIHTLFGKMHIGFAYLLCALIALHVLAVVHHLLNSGMRLVRRMLPWGA